MEKQRFSTPEELAAYREELWEQYTYRFGSFQFRWVTGDVLIGAETAHLTEAEADLLNGSASGAGSFDTEVSIDFESDCVRTSDTVLTLTLPAAAGYSIAGDETVTFGIPINLVNINGIPITASGNMVASPTTFVITNA